MKARIPTYVFKKALEKMAAVLDPKHELASYSKVRLDFEGNRLSLSASCASVSAELAIDGVESEGAFVCGTAGLLLKNIIDTFRADNVIADFRDNSLFIESNGSNFRLGTLTEDALLTRKKYNEISFQKINFKDLITAFDKVSYCYMKEEKDEKNFREPLSGIRIDRELIACTDGSRLSVYAGTNNFASAITLPIDSIKRLLKLYKECPDTGAMNINGTEVHFAANGIRATSKSLAGIYPNYRGLLPEKNNCMVAKVKKVDFMLSLNRVMLLSPQWVDLSFVNNSIIMVSSNNPLGNVKEVVPGLQVDNISTIRINPSFILDAVDKMKGDIVTIEVRPEKPIVVKEDSYVNIICQIRRD